MKNTSHPHARRWRRWPLRSVEEFSIARKPNKVNETCEKLCHVCEQGYECLSADQEQISRVADAENACMELKQPSEFDKTCSFKSGTKEAKTRGITTAQSTRAEPSEICVQLAAATGLTAAALKAKLLAEREEHEVMIGSAITLCVVKLGLVSLH